MKTVNQNLNNKDFLEPSAQFKSNVIKVIFAILTFVLVYLILVALSLCLLAASVVAGLGIIYMKVSWITLLLGAGLIGFGVMIVAFLIKFVFARTVDSNDQRIEITAEEQPALFEFVNQVAKDAGTDIPKKIFISPDVNAAVFYDSSFFSMFLPVKKNLNIGLGMVNSLNKSEFKAVIAHEFGHFSQRSMKLGTYVYTTNKVIYNLLYQNDGWNNTLISFANLHSVMNLFARLTLALANGIRYILIKVYEWIQLVYMALSREMEYHADLVAVSLAGNQQMINSLRRVEFSSTAYDFTTDHLDDLAKKKARCKNMYEVQSRSIIYLSRINHLGIEDGLPVITDEELEKRKPQGKIIIKDQWASHPSRADRESNINRWPVDVTIDTSSAWTLFDDPKALQEKMTSHLYDLTIPEAKNFEYISTDELFENIEAAAKSKTLPTKFEDFYSGRPINIENISVLETSASDNNGDTFESIYTEDFKSKIPVLLAMQSDRNTLEHIASKTQPIKSFDYDGKKYKQKDAAVLLADLDKNVAKLRNEIAEYDIRAFRFFIKKAIEKNSYDRFRALLSFHLDVQNNAMAFKDLTSSLRAIYLQLQSRSNWNDEDLIPIHEKTVDIKNDFEEQLKKIKTISIPQAALPDNITDIRRHLFDEPVAELHVPRFDYKWFAKLFNQTANSSQKTIEIWEYSYSQLLTVMDDLTDK